MKQRRDANEFEQRRHEGIALHESGIKQADIARRLKVSRQSVSRWIAQYQSGGKTALVRKARSGRPPRLSSQQKQALIKILAAGPEAAGYKTQLWTGKRICRLLKERFGLSYNAKYIPHLLRLCGWSYQKPSGRAQERDEERIAHWRRVEWPRIEKKQQTPTPP
jgi:transposase